MAVTHISEAEAQRNPTELFARVRAGEQIRIQGVASDIAMVIEKRKTLSEAIRLAELLDDDVTLDGDFERDWDRIITNHEHEAGMRNPWKE